MLTSDQEETSFTSPALNFAIAGSLNYLSQQFSYTDQYGAIGTHNPEEFFTRLFRNKYEQDPSTIQVARGVELLTESNRTQLEFLHDFALENAVLSVGSYNYTQSDGNSTSLVIPNVPLDVAAFGETALVYSALVGKTPTREQVAKLTLTPQYEVRPLADRATMIMEMPEYGARYGLAVPMLSLIDVPNGKVFDLDGTDLQITLEAVSLGADDLAGTHDDGQIRVVEVYLNGSLEHEFDNISNSSLLAFDLDFLKPSGEYLLEIFAEDINGLRSKIERSIVLTRSDDPSVDLISPEIGEVLYSDSVIDFEFNSSDGSLDAYLEIDDRIPWRGRLGFNGKGYPEDGSTVTLVDGTGRNGITFEFDSNNSASSTTIEDPVRIMEIGGGELTSSGVYRGLERREYIVEVDGDGSPDTFRWSLDGGRSFNDQKISIIKDQEFSLSAGVKITFSASSSYSKGDKWKILAYPVNEIVEIDPRGTFEERIAQTKENLIEAINRIRNEGSLALYARDMENSTLGGFSMQSLNRRSIELIHDGSYPIREAVTVTPSTSVNSFMAAEDILGLVSASGNSGTLSLDLKKLSTLKPILKVRVVGFHSDQSAFYSEPRYFAVRDRDRLFVEMLDPYEPRWEGRKATIRLTGTNNGSLSEEHLTVIDPGFRYPYDATTEADNNLTPFHF